MKNNLIILNHFGVGDIILSFQWSCTCSPGTSTIFVIRLMGFNSRSPKIFIISVARCQSLSSPKINVFYDEM